MRRIVFSIVFFALLTFLGCDLYSEDIESLLIYSQGPRDEYPVRGYEIDFFSDGMIKRIRQFRLSGIVDPYRWSESENLRTYVSDYITVRNGNEVTQYQVLSLKEKKIISTFENIASNTIAFNYHERAGEYVILFNGDLNVNLQDKSGSVLQTITYNDNEIIMLSPRVNYQEITSFDQFMLVGLRNERSNIRMDAQITYDGRNEYIIVTPDLNNELPFGVKITVLAPTISNFSQDAIILNRFLTFVTKGGESTYLLPFLSRRLIP